MARPTLPHGYLGAQSKFQEFGMSVVSHNSPEITTNTSPLRIQLRTANKLRVTANLLSCDKDVEHKDLIFSQTDEDGKLITLIVSIPDKGFFKLQIFALPSKEFGQPNKDQSTSLPNVYNYLIHSTAPPPGPVVAFPKQYAQWKDGCSLTKPFTLHNLDNAAFEVTIPEAKAVAVTVDGQWYPLTQGPDGAWRGEVKGLAGPRASGKKAVLNANFPSAADKNKYTSLLEYSL